MFFAAIEIECCYTAAMTETPPPPRRHPTGEETQAERAARSAQALRDNLHRRKAQTRQRSVSSPPPPAPQDE